MYEAPSPLCPMMRLPESMDLSGTPSCCVDWIKFLSLRPRQTVPTATELSTYLKHLKTHDKKSTSHSGNGVKKSAWAFTLTKSPSDDLTVADMIAAARKIMRQKSCPVKKYAWYLEYKGEDDNGLPAHPHIHGMYETEDGYKIEEKHFTRAWKIWRQKDNKGNVIKLGNGFRGGYHEAVEHETAYSDYIKKDGGIGETNIQE